MSISGLVAEYIVAIDVTRVRFPADACVCSSHQGMYPKRQMQSNTEEVWDSNPRSKTPAPSESRPSPPAPTPTPTPHPGSSRRGYRQRPGPRREGTPRGLASQCQPLGRGAGHMLSSAHVHMRGGAIMSCDVTTPGRGGRSHVAGLIARLVRA